jgi:hypothetical protein
MREKYRVPVKASRLQEIDRIGSLCDLVWLLLVLSAVKTIDLFT